MAEYRTRAPASAVAHGDLYSQKTANASLNAADWTAGADPMDATATLCPRAFVPNADGTLAIRGIDDSADTIIDVKEGVVYPIAIKQITRASCSAGLQIANAVALLY
jgi:hypothetical protein